MKLTQLTYETGIATLVQFIVLSLLNILNGITSVVSTCVKGQDCITNLLVSVILYLLLVGWFGFVWLLGYNAQERRSKRLAQLLICTEGLIALLAFYNIKHHNGAVGIITSIVDLVLCVWVIWLAFRLMRAAGKSVGALRPGAGRQRPRQRVRH
jgi:hypothetical protein